MLLLVLPTDLTIEIVGHLAATLELPMDDLHSLQVTYSFMRHIYGDPAIGHRVAMDWCRHEARLWNDLDNYYALLASLTQLGNPEACILTRIPMEFVDNHSPRPCLNDLVHIADGGHNLAAYLVALLLYRHNGDAGDDATAWWYIRRVEGKEES